MRTIRKLSIAVLILSNLTSYSFIDGSEVISYILSNRNSRGFWNYSTDYIYSELIDTFQVVRSLSEAGELSQIPEGEKDIIAESLSLFFMYGGFFLLSQDYASINLLHSLVLKAIIDKKGEQELAAKMKSDGRMKEAIINDILLVFS